MLRTVARPVIALALVFLASGIVSRAQPASADTIDTAALYFDGHDAFYRAPFGAVPSGSAVTVRFRTAHGGATAVTAYLERLDMSSTPTQVPMTLDTADSNAQNDFWQTTLT